MDDLIARMVKNKLKADPRDLELVKFHVLRTYLEEPDQESDDESP